MQKNCTRCKSKHLPPFGSRCKAMSSLIDGIDRDDEGYVKALEEEFAKLKLQVLKHDETEKSGDASGGAPLHPAVDRILDSLSDVTDRLVKLESSHVSLIHAKPTPSAADLMSAPLTKALSKLADSDEEDKGRPLRPETYSQSELKEGKRDFSKMDTLDLFYGWICVADYLVNSGGDVKSYISHVKFATQMLHSRHFYDTGAIHYDRQIIDRFVEGRCRTFAPDTVVSSLTFSPRLIPETVELCHGASLTKGVRSFTTKPKQRKRPQSGYRGVKSEEIPHDFPTDICFFFNYRQCTDDNCSRSHICRKCHGKHRADSCKEKTKNF